MNIMIVGGGLLGRKTAETLDEAGHDVVLIDASPENLAQLSPDFSGVTAVGFPMDIKSLRSAGIEGCDAVAVTTPDDNLNITVGQIAKNFFGIPKVIARISDPYRENIFERFGLQTEHHYLPGGSPGRAPLCGPHHRQRGASLRRWAFWCD